MTVRLTKGENCIFFMNSLRCDQRLLHDSLEINTRDCIHERPGNLPGNLAGTLINVLGAVLELLEINCSCEYSEGPSEK